MDEQLTHAHHTHVHTEREERDCGWWLKGFSLYNDTIISSLLLPWQHSNSTLIGPLSIGTHNPSLPIINHIQRISHLIATLPVPNMRLISIGAKLTELDFDTSSTHTHTHVQVYTVLSDTDSPPLSLSLSILTCPFASDRDKFIPSNLMASPKSLMQHVMSFLTSIFLLFRSLWAIAGL